MNNTNGANRNGSDSSRVCAPVGLTAEPTRCAIDQMHADAEAAEMELLADVPYGTDSVRVMRVGLTLDGNTDTRGHVSEEEREHLQAFGAEVRAMRKAAGLTQVQMGKLAGMGAVHVSRLETGRRRPSVDAIKALARILAPSGTSEAVEQRLGKLAGDSLREGAARRKRQRDNKHRREALAEAERAHRKMRNIIRDKESRGEIVAGDLRSFADRMGETVQRLRAKATPADNGIRGVRAKDARPPWLNRPRSRSQKDILEWLEASREFEEGDDQ